MDMGAYESAFVAVTMADVMRAPRIAGGLTIATAAQETALDVEPNNRIDLQDALRLAREVASQNP